MSCSVWYDGVSRSPLGTLSSAAEDAVLFQGHSNQPESSLWAAFWVTAGLRVVVSITIGGSDGSEFLAQPRLEAVRRSQLTALCGESGDTMVVEMANAKEVMALVASMGVAVGKNGRHVLPHHLLSVDFSSHSPLSAPHESSPEAKQKEDVLSTQSKGTPASAAMSGATQLASHLPTISLLFGSRGGSVGGNSTASGGSCCSCVILQPVACVEKRDRVRLRYHGTVHRVLPCAELVCTSPAGDVCLVLSPAACAVGRQPLLVGTALRPAARDTAAHAKAAQPIYWSDPDDFAPLRRGHVAHWLWSTSRSLARTPAQADACDNFSPFELTLVEASGFACTFRVDTLSAMRTEPSAVRWQLKYVSKVKPRSSRRRGPAAQLGHRGLPDTPSEPSLRFEHRWQRSPWLTEAMEKYARTVQHQRGHFEVVVDHACRPIHDTSSQAAATIAPVAVSGDGRVALCRDILTNGTRLFLTSFVAAGDDAAMAGRETSGHGTSASHRRGKARCCTTPVVLPRWLAEDATVEFQDAVFVCSKGMHGFLCVFRRPSARARQSADLGVMWAFVPLAGIAVAVVVSPCVRLETVPNAGQVALSAGRLFVVRVEHAVQPDPFGDSAVRVALGNTQCPDHVLRASVTLPAVRAWLCECYLTPLCRGEYKQHLSAGDDVSPHLAMEQLRLWVMSSLLGILTTDVGAMCEGPFQPTRESVTEVVANASSSVNAQHSIYAPPCAAVQFLDDALAPLTAPLITMGYADQTSHDKWLGSTTLAGLSAVFQGVAVCARLLQDAHTAATDTVVIPLTPLAAPLAACVSRLVETLETLVSHGATAALMACIGPFMWSGSTAPLTLPLQRHQVWREAAVVMSWRCLWAPLFDAVYPMTFLTTSPLAPREALLPYCSATLREVDGRSHRWAVQEAAQRTITAEDGTAQPLLGWSTKPPSAREVLTAMRRGDARDVRTLSLEHVLATAQRLVCEAGPSAGAEYLSYFTCHEGCHASLVSDWQRYTALDQQTRSLIGHSA